MMGYKEACMWYVKCESAAEDDAFDWEDEDGDDNADQEDAKLGVAGLGGDEGFDIAQDIDHKVCNKLI
jgi:hypothetical protein